MCCRCKILKEHENLDTYILVKIQILRGKITYISSNRYRLNVNVLLSIG